MSKLHVYVLYKCAEPETAKMGNVVGIYLTKEGAEVKKKKINKGRNKGYYAILRKTLKGQTCGFGDGMHFVYTS